MITNFSHTNSLLSQWMCEIRDVNMQTNRMQFRNNMERIGEVAAYEISKLLPYKQIGTQTPLGISNCAVLEVQPVIATILRAGLPLYQGLLNYFDKADSAFVGAYRRHRKDETFDIYQEYITCPQLEGRPLIIADPMLATGASLEAAIAGLVEYDQPSQIHIVTVIASTIGIQRIKRRFPAAHIWTGAIDEELTAKGYIVPGLGDAGDLSFGEKRQS